MSKRKKPGKSPLIRKIVRSLLVAMVCLMLFTVCQVVVFKYVDPPITVPVVWEYLAKRLQAKPYRPPVRYWVPIGSISPHLQKAVLAAEDQRFTAHNGFDFTEINAAIEDMFAEKRIRGASTISMQTARTVFLLPARNLARKLLEAYYTVLIEIFWSKKRILEVYLNTVDWGTGIMGAEAAARKYYHTSSKMLNPSQAARLASILPNPHRFSPVRPSRYIQGRAKRILADMPHMPLL